MKFKVAYERKTTSSCWLYSSKVIEVKGIVHAHNRAKDHLREIQRLSSIPVRIDKIIFIPEAEDL